MEPHATLQTIPVMTSFHSPYGFPARLIRSVRWFLFNLACSSQSIWTQFAAKIQPAAQPISPPDDMQVMRAVLTNSEVEDWSLVAKFWDSPELVQWFKDREYSLYTRLYHEQYGSPTIYTVPSLPFDIVAECHYPYAYHNGDATLGAKPLCARDSTGKVIFAQDAQLHHVAIKLVLGDSDEYRILRFLHDKGLDTARENCIVPVLDLLPYKGFWFAVMPRWGTNVPGPEVHTVRESLHVMHSMLKGLAFLHAHNIIHRDMKMDNTLVNHFTDECSIELHPAHAELRRLGKLSYAIMDCNISIMAPPDIDKKEYRLDYRSSLQGSWNQPYDTRAGEFEYNPFAFDVGCLGVEFCIYFQHYTPQIPMLAPLLDQMTTWDIEKRFTAAEALQFFEKMRCELTEDQLNMPESDNPVGGISYHEYDRWQGLPEDFQIKWALYRAPPVPFIMQILRKITWSHYLPLYVLPSIRRFFFRLACVPLSWYTRFLALIGQRSTPRIN